MAKFIDEILLGLIFGSGIFAILHVLDLNAINSELRRQNTVLKNQMASGANVTYIVS